MEWKNTEVFAEETLMQSRKHFSKVGFVYLLGAIMIFAVQFLLGQILWSFVPQLMENSDFLLVVSSLSMYVIAMPMLVMLAKRIPSVEIQKSHKMGIGKWFVAFFMCYALMYLSNLAGVFITTILGFVIGDPVSNPLQEVVTELSPVTACFVMVVCAPIAEEYVFRKVLVDRTVRYGEKNAIVLSGLMFALFHGNLNQFVYAFGLGVFLGFIYAKTGRIVYTITLHAALNFMGSVPGLLLLKMEVFTQLEQMSEDPSAVSELFLRYPSQILLYVLFMVLILILVIIGCVCWALNFKKMKCEYGKVTLPKGRRFRTIILNAGMGFYCLFWIVQMIQQIFTE